MPLNDYLTGIDRYTNGPRQDVSNAAKDLSTLQVGAGALPAKLKEALNTKLNNNRDLINQQADTMQTYFNSGANAREKYQDVWDPFKKANLVQQDRSAALRPYDILSGVLENRMGSVNDIVQSGIQGWQGMVNAATTKAELAKSMLANALSQYGIGVGQENNYNQLSLDAAKAKESSRQFGISSGMEQQKINNQSSQFSQELAAKFKLASMSGGSGGGGTGPGGSYTAADIQGIADGLMGLGPGMTAQDIAAVTTDKNINAVWAELNKKKAAEASKVEQLNREKAAADAEKAKNGIFARTGNWISDYFKGNEFQPTIYGGTFVPKK